MRHLLATLFGVIMSASAAQARCPLWTNADYVARAAAVFTGRAIALGPASRNSRMPAWADLDVLDSETPGLPARVRVRAPDVAMYTLRFEQGRSCRLYAFREGADFSANACGARSE